MNKLFFFVLFFYCFSCKPKTEKIKPQVRGISESVYASGKIKSKNQYEAFATVNGLIEAVFLKEGDTVKAGTPILSIAGEAQKLQKENAALAAKFLDINANKDKLREARQSIELSKRKMRNDSSLFFRQKQLWQNKVGSRVDLEQRELAYENSKTNYRSAIVNYNDLKNQLEFESQQSKKNLSISRVQEHDFTLRSQIDGVVYRIYKTKGELVGLQTPLAVIGDARQFILEMQVDENDIFKIKKDMITYVTMDSYKGSVFEARISKIAPLMNEASKTFLVEATFVKQPPMLYPNINFEANIVLNKKTKALLIPRNYLLKDSFVTKSNGDTVLVKTGLQDYQQVEILSGIGPEDELKKPAQ